MSQTTACDRLLQLMMLCRKQRWSLCRYEIELRRYYAQPRFRKLSAVPSWIRWKVHDVRLSRRNERQAKREDVQKKVQRAVASGELIKPSHCQHCGRRTIKWKLQGHHQDYRYPLRVIWLCQSCHVKAQGKRAIKRAAFHASKRELRQRFLAKEKKLRQRYRTGEISKYRYRKLRRELHTKFEKALVS
jgi:hypothetical protein